MAKFNFALQIVDEDIVKKLEELSQQAAKENNSPYVIGENSIPHITLAQFESDLEATQLLANSILGIKLGTNKYIYVNLGRYAIWLNSYYGFEITTNNVTEFSQYDLKLNDVKQQVEDLIYHITHSSVFYPHVTLGCNKNIPPRYTPIKHNIAEDKNIRCRLVLGNCGPEGQLSEILYEW